MTLQRFKENDATELKVITATLPALNPLGVDRDTFFAQADDAAPLGDVLYALDRSPMAGVLTQDVFRISFNAIHQLFTRPGTFEFYLTVFRAIWGDNVSIVFTVPAPGKLQINIGEITIETFNLVARRIQNNAYVYDRMLTEAGDVLIAKAKIGTKNQSEVNALIREISPAGIYITTTLSLG